MKNTIFEKITSEDALNIVNSKFNIKNIEFTESKSDSVPSPKMQFIVKEMTRQ